MYKACWQQQTRLTMTKKRQFCARNHYVRLYRSCLPEGSCKAFQVAGQEQEPCQERTEHTCKDSCTDSFEVHYSGTHRHHSQKIGGIDVYTTCCHRAMLDPQSQV
jgi:hypothetical protein